MNAIFTLQHATQILAIPMPPVRTLEATLRVLVTQAMLGMATLAQVRNNVYMCIINEYHEA